MAQSETLRRYIEACIAFTDMTRARAEEVVRELARTGEVQWDQVQGQVDDLVDWSRRNTEQVVGLVRNEVGSELTQLGIVTKEYVNALEKRLEERMDDLATRWSGRGPSRTVTAPSTSKSPARKSAARKSTAKSTTAKSTTARKSTAKKTTAKKTTAKATAKKAPAKKTGQSTRKTTGSAAAKKTTAKATAKKAPAKKTGQSTRKTTGSAAAKKTTAAGAARARRLTARASVRPSPKD